MPRRLLNRCVPDSIREFRAAARQRFEDGRTLAMADRRTAAIYLWGYSAEMTLKAAYFAVIGFADTQTITVPDLRAAALTAPGLGVIWPGLPRNPKLHDLRAWADLLAATRIATPRMAYGDPSIGTRMVTRCARLQHLWSEILRYHKNVAYIHEMEQVRDAAAWLLLYSSQL
jgi:hypothetical protein